MIGNGIPINHRSPPFIIDASIVHEYLFEGETRR